MIPKKQPKKKKQQSFTLARIRALRSTVGKLLNHIKGMKRQHRDDLKSLGRQFMEIIDRDRELAKFASTVAKAERDYWKARAEEAEENSRQIRFNSLPPYNVS